MRPTTAARPAFRAGVIFLRQDIRSAQPERPFDLVLCRNLIFTYFDPSLQRPVLADIAARMRPGAALVVGKDEAVPAAAALEPEPAGLGTYWRSRSASPRNLATKPADWRRREVLPLRALAKQNASAAGIARAHIDQRHAPWRSLDRQDRW